MASLLEQLKAARPGDTVSFRGNQRIGKVTGITGRADAWITLIGEDDSACLVPDPGYRAAVFRPEGCRYFQWGQFAVDGDGQADRCIQVFTSSFVKGYDLVTRGCRYDHLHLVNTSQASFHRLHADGDGGEWLRPGVGPHAPIYIAEGCSVVLVEDVEAVRSLGAPVQVNGQDGDSPITGVTFRRFRIRDWQEGFGANLLGCANVVMEDFDLETACGEANGGIYADSDTSGISVVRFRIMLSGGKPQFTGSISKQPGDPLPPNFGAAPPEPEPPQPETDYEELYRQEKAKNDEAAAWYRGAPAWLRS